MLKSRIEWVKNPDGTQGYTINPVKGLCPMDCKDNQGKSYCYARKLYRRFKWNPEIRFDLTIEVPKKPSRIFVGSTMELFGDWIQPNWLKLIFQACRDFPEHTYIFLTKQPQNLMQWEFPKNCWIGVTATNLKQYREACIGLSTIKARVKFLSIEPLLEYIPMQPTYEPVSDFCNWLIIGQLTPVKKATMPKIQWVEEIVGTADKMGIPVFLKNNLYPLLGLGDGKSICHNNENGTLRQEMPLIAAGKE